MATVIKKVKVLLDEHQEPFIPFVTTDAVFKNGSDEKLTDFLDNYIAQKDEQVEAFLEEADTDIAELIRQAGVDVNAIIQDLEYKRDHGYFTGPPGPQGDPGIQGEPGEKGETGAGVVPGGTTGQVLTKKSDNDYDTEWADASDMSNYYNKEEVDAKDDVLRERISEIELSKFPNVTIFGEPTILQGQVSNFSADDYLEFPFMVDFRGRPFEINFTFTTEDDIDNQQNILDSDFGLAFAIRSKHIVLAVSYNGTSWALERTGSLVLESQKTYRIRISWDGSSYKVQYSIDGGTTYIDDITFDSNQTPYPKQMYIGVGKLASNYFKGSINLNYADVKISDHVIWQGMDDAGLALRADINLENITEVAEQKIKDIAGGEDIIELTGTHYLRDLESGWYKLMTGARLYTYSVLSYVRFSNRESYALLHVIKHTTNTGFRRSVAVFGNVYLTGYTTGGINTEIPSEQCGIFYIREEDPEISLMSSQYRFKMLSTMNVVDNFNQSSYSESAPTVLSARQGNLLNLNKLESSLSNINQTGIDKIKEIAGEVMLDALESDY